MTAPYKLPATGWRAHVMTDDLVAGKCICGTPAVAWVGMVRTTDTHDYYVGRNYCPICFASIRT